TSAPLFLGRPRRRPRSWSSRLGAADVRGSTLRYPGTTEGPLAHAPRRQRDPLRRCRGAPRGTGLAPSARKGRHPLWHSCLAQMGVSTWFIGLVIWVLGKVGSWWFHG